MGRKKGSIEKVATATGTLHSPYHCWSRIKLKKKPGSTVMRTEVCLGGKVSFRCLHAPMPFRVDAPPLSLALGPQ
jgi:hypothetical protein